MKNVINTFCAVIICLFCTGTGIAQTTKAEKKAAQMAELKRVIDSKRYIFKASAALPTPANVQVTGGSSLPNNIINQLNSGVINLTSSYDMKISNDTLSAYLPYYGQAFSAPYNSNTDGGINFKSTKFDYTVTKKKNGNLEIFIKPLGLTPRAPSDVQRMMLTVSEGGWATLQVTLLTRQRIAFNGIIEEIKPARAS